MVVIYNNLTKLVVDIQQDGFEIEDGVHTAVSVTDNLPDIGMYYDEAKGEFITKWQSMGESDKLEMIRRSRNNYLVYSDFAVFRHRDQLDNSEDVTLTSEQYTELLNYRKALRDFPENVDLNVDSFDDIVWPAVPSFM